MQNYKVNSTYLTLQVFYFRKVQFASFQCRLSLGLENLSLRLKIQSAALARECRRWKKLPQRLTRTLVPNGLPGAVSNVKTRGWSEAAEKDGFIGSLRAHYIRKFNLSKTLQPFSLPRFTLIFIGFKAEGFDFPTFQNAGKCFSEGDVFTTVKSRPKLHG